MIDIISGIYCIENIVNKKKYIGKGANIDERRRRHFNNLRKNKHANNYLQLSWNKYGENSFKFYLLEECPTEQLSILEIELIEEFNTFDREFGYNLTKGGEGVTGFKHSAETKKLLSEISSKQIHSQETRDKIGKGNKGKFVSQETCKKASETRIGKPIIKNRKNDSRHVGVYFYKHKIKNPWEVMMTIGFKKRMRVGNFPTEKEGIEAYENAYLKYFGKPYINKLESEE